MISTPPIDYFLIPLIGLIAFFLKGLIGTGTTTVIVALSSLVIDPKLTIVLASFVNIFGGLAMVRIDRAELPARYWVAISIMMVIGSVVGAAALAVIPNEPFQLILGAAFFGVALWFLLRVPGPREHAAVPGRASISDLGVGGFAGFCGGFIGINAPPLVLHFGRYLDKRNLRRLLVLIFIPAAIAQTATFYINGMLSTRIVTWGLLIIPTMVIGIHFGNRSFQRLSEVWFRRALGCLLLFVSLRLIIRVVL